MSVEKRRLVASSASPARRAGSTDVLVGARVKLRRKTLDLSQQELANSLEIAIQQLQKYESGRNRISASQLYEISQLLRVPIDWFFSDAPSSSKRRPTEPETTPTVKMTRQALNAQLKILVKNFFDIKSGDDRQVVIDFAKTLTKTQSRRRAKD